MMFLNKGKGSDPSSKPAKRSLLGLMFMPNFGDSIRPMGGAFSLFVNLIAMVFAMNGMFPKDHPALTGDKNAKLRLSEILATAWGGLEFTPRGAPKVLLFFAVSSAIVLTVLSFVTAALLGFASSAHAQQSYFTPEPNDLASNWLDLLFNEAAYAEARARIAQEVGAYVLPSSNIQSALTAALGIYSNAMLIVAAIMLFYYLVTMVVETAHHGEAMGKRANKIWAPIRMVVAVGLLVPVSSGLNSGQYIVLKTAKMGCALASVVWESFVVALVQDMQSSGGGSGTAGDPLSSVAVVQETKAVAYNLLMMYACQYSYNYQIHVASQGFLAGAISFDSDYINGRPWNAFINSSGHEGNTAPGKYSFSNSVVDDYDLCGSFTIPAQPVPSETELNDTFKTAYDGVVSTFSNQALVEASRRSINIGSQMTYMDTSIPGVFIPPNRPTPDDVTAVADILRRGLGDVTRNISSSSVVANLANKIGEKSIRMGWVAAGSWFNSLATVQADISGIIDQSMPATNPPQIGQFGGPSSEDFDAWFGKGKKAETGYVQAKRDLDAYSKVITSSEPGAASQAFSGSTVNDTSEGSLPTSGGCSSLTGCLLAIVGLVAEYEGIWQQNAGGGGASAATLTSQNIGVQFRGNNPLMEMSAWGHKCVHAAIVFFNVGAVLSTLGVVGQIGMFLGGMGAAATAPVSGPIGIIIGIVGVAASVLGPAIASMLMLMGGIFFGMGTTLAYIVPLLPFMHFFFNTITWAACVAEALVAIPLIALAHINPEGDGISGKAHGAYERVFGVFLRPVMMLFGLICGLLVMYVAVGLLNALFASAVSGVGGTGTAGTHMVIGRVIFSVIYVALIYSVANHATALIGRFPNAVFGWVAWSSAGGETMGHPGQIATATGLAAGYMGKEAGNAVKGMGESLSKVGGDAVAKNYGKRLETQKADALAAGKAGNPMPSGGGMVGLLGRKEIEASHIKGANGGEMEMFKRMQAGAAARNMSMNDYVRSPLPDIMTEVASIAGSPVMNGDAFMANYLAKAHLIS